MTQSVIRVSQSSVAGSRASDALQELIRLFNPLAQAPKHLFPGGALVSGSIRIKQLIYGYSQLLYIKLRREPLVIIGGKKLARFDGWVDVSINPPARKILKMALTVCPIVPVATDAATMSKFWNRFTVDESDHLESFLNQNGNAIVRARSGGVRCVVHYGCTPQSYEAVLRHAAGLGSASVSVGSVLDGLLPTIVGWQSDGETKILIQQEVPGRTPSFNTLSDQQIDIMTEAAIRPLKDIHTAHQRFSRRFGHEFVDTQLSRIAAVFPGYQSQLSLPTQMLKRWIDERQPICVPTHADYAPRNVFFEPDLSRVTGIIDWEWFWHDGVAGFDFLYWMLEVEATRRKQSLFPVIEHFLEEPRNACFEPVFEHAAGFALSRDDLRHLAILIWLRMLWIGCIMTEPVNKRWIEKAMHVGSRLVNLPFAAEEGMIVE